MAGQKNNNSDSRQRSRESSAADETAAEESCEVPSKNRPVTMIRPVTKKIGEGKDNLRARGEWYRRRTEGS